MSVSVRVALAALRSVWAECKAATDPKPKLIDALNDRAGGGVAALSGGSVRSTSGNGHHVTFSDSSGGNNPTGADMVEMYVYLTELHDRAKSFLGGEPEDQAIETQMELYLRPVTGYQNDWRFMVK